MLPPSLRSSVYQILGPGSLSGQMFADLCDQLLLSEAASEGYTFKAPSDRAGDFKGLDSYSDTGAGGNFDGIRGRVGFQYKFFASESATLGKNHQREVESSLLSAKRNNPRLSTWVLITPEDFNKHQEEWFLNLRSTHSVQFNIAHWGQKQLSRLISKFPESAMHIYPELVPGFRPPTFKEMCTSLIRRFARVPHHSLYHLDIKLTNDCSTDVELNEFIEDDSRTLFCLLGGYGTGKTTALEHLSLFLARKFLNDPSSRIPLLIRMRYIRGMGTFRDNLMRYFETEYGLKLDVTTLQSLNASGKTVMLFDGLDESDGSSQKKLGKGVLSEIYEFLSLYGKLVISSRTEFFNSAVEERTDLFGLHRPHVLNLNGQTVYSLDSRGTITYVDLLLPDQIENYVSKRMGVEAGPTISRVNTIYDLKDIVRRPVLLDMVCETLPYFKNESREILASDLYDRYITQHLIQDIEAGRIIGPIEQRLNDISQVAEHMLVNKRFRLPHTEITKELLRTESGGQGFLTAAFLLRDPNGVYEFSHYSFTEYFGALRMFMDVKNLNLSSPIWKELSRYTKEQLEFFNQIVESHWRMHSEQDKRLLDPREPVTLEQFRDFLQATGYRPLSPVVDVLGYAAVSWFDAIAYTCWNGSRIQSARELIALINSEFPYQLPISETPAGSVYSIKDESWKSRVLSPGGIIFLRGLREWASPVTQVGDSWVLFSDGRKISSFRLSRGDLAIGVFRCVFSSPKPESASV